MTEPASAAAPVPASQSSGAAPTERGWGKLLIALAAFLLIPGTPPMQALFPHLRALLPVEQTMLLFVPAVAACALVGWWAGGRAFLAVAWVAIAVLLTARAPSSVEPVYNLARGWSLLLAGSCGLVCLFDSKRPRSTRSLLAPGTTSMPAMV